MNIRVRHASPEDAKSLLEIYSYYVENTAVTYEYVVPSVDEFRKRIEDISDSYPYFVAEVDGVIAGYIYASRYRTRAAFDWCAETSIYINEKYHGLGIGRLLYEELETVLFRQNVVNVYAIVATPVEEDDEYLTFDSKRFHEKIGYTVVGELKSCGSKFGRWYSLISMEKVIAPHLMPPKKFIKFTDLE